MAQTPHVNPLERVPIITLLMMGFSVPATVSSSFSTLLMLDREAIAAGEVWRLFVFPFVHFGWVHLAYNMAALGVAGWIAERKSRLRYVLLCTLMAPAIGSWLLLTEPDMSLYGGMSAMVCGIFFYGALTGRERAGPWRPFFSFIVFLLPTKVAYEFFQKSSILPYGDHQYFVVMPSSHAAGLALGLVFYAMAMAARSYPILKFGTRHRQHHHRTEPRRHQNRRLDHRFRRRRRHGRRTGCGSRCAGKGGGE